ncbi:MAG: hypothetical protein JXR68_13095, partial [Bacteroidales bacterium]|nr:hypothetical protein [Bacteroidales bacterium]
MLLKISLILSVLLQFGASFLAFGLIKKSKYNISWILISSAFLLMAIRRLFEIIMILNYKIDEKEALINSWITVLISALIFVGTFYIRQIFDFQHEMDILRKQNETKILSAVLKAEENERSKTAKELHDGLAPLLSTAKMFVTAIEKEKIGTDNLQIIEKMEVIVDNSITTLKEISNNISPHILVNFGLEVAIKKYLQNIDIQKQIKLNFISNLNKNRIDSEIETVVYRVVCELITNSKKHSNCRKIDANIFYGNGILELFYFDDGKGFNTEILETTTGMGLSNIFSRIKSVNGTVDFNTNPKSGFWIRIKIPLNE